MGSGYTSRRISECNKKPVYKWINGGGCIPFLFCPTYIGESVTRVFKIQVLSTDFALYTLRVFELVRYLILHFSILLFTFFPTKFEL